MRSFIVLAFLLTFSVVSFCQNDRIKAIDSLSVYMDGYKTNPKKGFKIIDSIHKVAIRLNIDTVLAKTTYSKGMAFFYLGNYDSSLYYWNKSVDLFTRLGNEKRVGDCLQNIGKLYELNGNYITANENYQESLKIFEKLNLNDRAANTLNVIGSLNNLLENFEIAETYFVRALNMYSQLIRQTPNNKYVQLGYGVTQNNLGMVKSSKHEYPDAISFYEKAEKSFREIPDTFYLAFILHNLGSVYSETGNFERSEKYFLESEKYNQSLENIQLKLMTLSAKGELRIRQKNAAAALVLYQEGLRMAAEIRMTRIILNSYKGLSDAYKMLGDYPNSLLYFEKFAILKDSLLTQSKYKQIMELQTMYETEKKEKIIAHKDKQLRQQIFIFAAVSMFLILMLSLLFFLFRTREIRKRYKLENDLNLSTQRALVSQMNPHFIFNALNSIQLYILKNDKISSNLFLTNFADLMRKVLENSQFHFISLFEEMEALKTYLELEKARFVKKFGYEMIFPEHVSLNDYLIPTMILQPFAENSIWHGFSTLEKEGHLRIEILLKQPSELLIIMEDNGIGREKAGEITTKNGKERKTHGTKLVEERFRLYNQLHKTNIGFDYVDLRDDHGHPAGTRVLLHLQQIVRNESRID